MAVIPQRIAERIFDICKSRGYNMKLYDLDGNRVFSSNKAYMFFCYPDRTMIIFGEEEGQSTIKVFLSKKLELNKENMEFLNQIRLTATHFGYTYHLTKMGKELKPKDFTFLLSEMNKYNTNKEKSMFGLEKLLEAENPKVQEVLDALIRLMDEPSSKYTRKKVNQLASLDDKSDWKENDREFKRAANALVNNKVSTISIDKEELLDQLKNFDVNDPVNKFHKLFAYFFGKNASAIGQYDKGEFSVLVNLMARLSQAYTKITELNTGEDKIPFKVKKKKDNTIGIFITDDGEFNDLKLVFGYISNMPANMALLTKMVKEYSSVTENITEYFDWLNKFDPMSILRENETSKLPKGLKVTDSKLDSKPHDINSLPTEIQKKIKYNDSEKSAIELLGKLSSHDMTGASATKMDQGEWKVKHKNGTSIVYIPGFHGLAGDDGDFEDLDNVNESSEEHREWRKGVFDKRANETPEETKQRTHERYLRRKETIDNINKRHRKNKNEAKIYKHYANKIGLKENINYKVDNKGLLVKFDSIQSVLKMFENNKIKARFNNELNRIVIEGSFQLKEKPRLTREEIFETAGYLVRAKNNPTLLEQLVKDLSKVEFKKIMKIISETWEKEITQLIMKNLKENNLKKKIADI